eukprot:3441105-Amphidinium_carterae.1
MSPSWDSNSSQNNTTVGWKTLTDMKLKPALDPLQTLWKLPQSSTTSRDQSDGPIGQHVLMLIFNSTTTFAEVHTWIANYVNSTHNGTDDESGTIGG